MIDGADWVSCPGETLQETLEYSQIPTNVFQADPAAYMSPEELAGILAGTTPIELEHARVIAHHTGTSVHFWMNFEHLYRTGLARGAAHVHDD